MDIGKADVIYVDKKSWQNICLNVKEAKEPIWTLDKPTKMSLNKKDVSVDIAADSIQTWQPETYQYVTGWAVALTCCISQWPKYRKSGIFGYPWKQNPWTDRHETWRA